MGLPLGAVDLLVMAFAERRHHGAGVVARVPAALSLTLLAAGLAPGLGALAVAVACAGFFVAPALTTSCPMPTRRPRPASAPRPASGSTPR
ncbi:hypothetical protein [Streptomyces sp. NPDC127066]|uniref:hypothetical protein n=1 Tax=Streptomyces sp. NPDC127066 TaxID=3347125 RepID=UPI003654E564